MKKLGLLVICFCMISSMAFSQKQMSLKDAIIGAYTYLRPQSPRELCWRDNSNYVFVKGDSLIERSVKSSKEHLLITLEDLNNAGEKDSVSFSSFPEISFLNKNQMIVKTARYQAIFNLSENQFSSCIKLPNKSQFTDYCPTINKVAYVKGQNLFIKGNDGEIQVTNENKPGVLCGRTVHRNEFGITKGTFWSVDGKYLAFYRKDESMVADYPLVNYMGRVAKLESIKYPMAGMASHQVTVGIYNLETGKTVYLKTGLPKDHYLTNITWGPKDQYIYISELNRDQNDMHLNQYDVTTGEKTKTLLEQTRSTYVEPLHPLFFSKTHPNQFYYWNRYDGWSHLSLYNTDGKCIKKLTKGNWEVTDFYGADAKDKYVYFKSTEESPLQQNIYRVNTSNGKIERLSPDNGTHYATFSPDKSWFLDKWTATDVPLETALTSNKGKKAQIIKEGSNTLKNYDLGKNKVFTIKAADDSTDLYCRMILPPNFNPEKKYPVIVYVYGGPHVQLITDTWHNGARWWQYYMASKGYIAFTVDSRGSSNRGQAFEEVVHRHLGVNETADQMKGIDYLKSLPYVDTDRIGVHGWSFGGFMTLNLKLRNPGVFKVAVAGGPVVDWKMYEVMYGERYMDTPQENPEGYKNSNMINYVKNLQGKLMIIHGVQDQTVVMQHSMKFLRECVKENKPVDFFCYPTHPHNVSGKDRLHLMEKVSQYFFDYL